MVRGIQNKLTVNECSDIIKGICQSCYGVVGMATPNGVTLMSQLLPAFMNKRGVEILHSENGYKINVYIIAEYGTNFKVISKNLCDMIKYTLKNEYNLYTDGINIHIKGVRRSRV